MALLRRKKSGRRGSGRSPVAVGIVAAVILIVLVYFGFTKTNPFSSPFQLEATFRSVSTLRTKAPVRIAGVDVGKVTQITPLPGTGAKVTMSIDPAGLPIHTDAQLKIRERIFLEGNEFVDVQPGSPSAPNVKQGDTIPVNQTATPVQFSDLLTSLQSDTRKDLRTLLAEYAVNGLGNGGATAYNNTLKDSPEAFRNASLANDATLGLKPHDLSNLERGQQRLFHSLSTNPQTLQDLVVQLNTTANAFAVQDVALGQTVPALRDTLKAGTPALASLNDALPSLRTFARTALPGTVSSGPTIDASLPFLTQLRLLVRRQELRGLVSDLRPTIPALARLNASTVPFLTESRTFSACTNNTLLPFVKTPIPDPDFPANSGQPVYKQLNRSLVGLAGESRIGDANTPYFHANVGTGATTAIESNNLGEQFFAQAPQAPQGFRPARPNDRPPFRPGQPCEKQVVPDLNAPGQQPSPTQSFTAPGSGLLPPLPANKALAQEAQVQLAELKGYFQRKQQGQPAVFPLNLPPKAYLLQMKQLGLGVTATGRIYSLRHGGGH